MQEVVLLAVVVVNYRTPQVTINCVESILPDLLDTPSRIVVVDNASDDGSCSILNEWIVEKGLGDKLVLIESDSNEGFSAGNNIGIRSVDARYYLLLNSDVIVKDTSVHSMLDRLESDENIGLLSPRLFDGNGHDHVSCFRRQSWITEFLGTASTGVFDRIFKRYSLTIMRGDPGISKPDWATFAAVMIRGEVFNDVGLLDSGYFMYFEDSEFCFRAKQANWKIAYSDSSEIVHLRGGSSSLKNKQSSRERLPRFYYEARSRYFFQTSGYLGLLGANIGWSIGALIGGVRFLLGSKDHKLVERAWVDIWVNFFSPMKRYTHPRLKLKRK